MAPKKVTKANDSSVRRPNRLTIEKKKEIIAYHENGVRVCNLATLFGLAKSTISTILKNKEVIKAANVAKGVTVLTKQRPQIIEEIEKLLLVWIHEKELAGDKITKSIVCEKARKLHSDLIVETPSTSVNGCEDFKASRGWFEKFRKRSGIQSVVRPGEASSSNKKAAEEFAIDFEKFVESENYIPNQVFNCNETRLFWKKMPKRTYIAKEEEELPGHKPENDRLTLLLCANASGDCKIKPLLIHHSESVLNNKLPVMWRSNTNACVTRVDFMVWIIEVFAPTVKKYLEENGLPLKCLLVMNSTPAHPPNFEKQLNIEYNFIKVKFLPPNITPLLQPMGQQVISNFKKLHIKELFSRCFQITYDTNLTLRDFWKDHFNISNCVSIIDKAWNELSYCTFQSAWKNLWSTCVPDIDFDYIENKEMEVKVVDEIVSIGQSMDLDVNSKDIEELVEYRSDELSVEELIELQREQVNAIQEEHSLEEDNDRKEVSVTVINDICKKWSEVQEFIENHHPNKSVTNRAVNIINDNVMPHFWKMLQKSEIQISQDWFSETSSESISVKVEVDSPSN